MFGLDKQKQPPLAQFDLESDLQQHPEKALELKSNIEKQVQELKTRLREGTSSKHFDELGAILHAYLAMQKVVERIIKNH